jgi:hypothetical protein
MRLRREYSFEQLIARILLQLLLEAGRKNPDTLNLESSFAVTVGDEGRLGDDWGGDTNTIIVYNESTISGQISAKLS